MAVKPKIPTESPEVTQIMVTGIFNIYDDELDITLLKDELTSIPKITKWLQYHIDAGYLKVS